ncbi:MAG: hypothetical protein Q9199_002790, partial [Rusavskia elegans]
QQIHHARTATKDRSTSLLARNVCRRSSFAGHHVPATRKRDEFYAKLEDERARKAGIK